MPDPQQQQFSPPDMSAEQEKTGGQFPIAGGYGNPGGNLPTESYLQFCKRTGTQPTMEGATHFFKAQAYDLAQQQASAMQMDKQFPAKEQKAVKVQQAQGGRGK